MDVDKYKITEKDMAGKGVSPQSNPMELPEAEAKAVFDQLVKEVVVPFFNKFVEAFANVDLTSDADKPISIATQAALDKKVDKAYKTGSQSEYKVLSDNNFDDNSKENLALATRDRHTHANKSLLDKFTQYRRIFPHKQIQSGYCGLCRQKGNRHWGSGHAEVHI